MWHGTRAVFDDHARLRLLHELGRAFAARTDLDELCRLVTEKCADVLDAEGVSILLLDAEKDELFFPFVTNANPEAAARLRELRFPARLGVAGYTLTSGRAVRIDDAAHDARFYAGVDRGSGATTHALMAAPLESENGTIGVLQVVNRRGGGAFSDADLGFLESIAGHVAVAIENARLLAQTREQLLALQRATEEHAALEALRRELDIAREIQRSILPTTFPPFPRHTEFELFAAMLPARDVSGDFYDFFLIDDRTLGVVIGDVSGKGMPAALFMAVSRTLVKATALAGLSPARCLDRVNRMLLAENPSDMFVSLFYGVLDLASGRLVFSNGGHNPPLWRRRDGAIERLSRTGTILGVLDDAAFSEAVVDVRPGDSLLLYTDGVTEAADADARPFGDAALVDLLAATSAAPSTLVHEVIAGVQAHSRGTAPTDDLTLLAIRFLG